MSSPDVDSGHGLKQSCKKRRKRKSCVSARTSRRRMLEELSELAACAGSTPDVGVPMNIDSDEGIDYNSGELYLHQQEILHSDIHEITAGELIDVTAARNEDSSDFQKCSDSKLNQDFSDLTKYRNIKSGIVSSDQSEAEEWFDALDFGYLNFDCELCMCCTCIHCDVCHHGLNNEDCVHCDKCLKGDELSDHSEHDGNISEDENEDESMCNDSVVLSEEDMLNNAMKNDLISISLKHNLSHAALEDVLLFLRKYNVGKFPKSPKTLMKTPHATVTRFVPPGEYWHNGLTKLVQSYVKSVNCSEVNIKFSYDSIPIAKSSASSFSPISCTFNDSNHVYLIGVYHGSQKPADSNDLLSEFVKEAIHLCEDGLQYGDRNIIVRVICAICDAPAKSSVLKVKGHGAYFGCTKCTVEGEYLDHRMSYLDLNAPLRTDQSFVNQEQEDYHEGRTILETIPSFGLVTGVPLDYMHLVLLGVMRKLIYMWLSGPLCVRLSAPLINKLSQALERIIPSVPKEFVRRTRSLQFVKRFKATEFRQILLYTGPVVLVDVLPRDLYQHFLVLHVAISLLANPKLSVTHIDYARELLRYFVESFSKLYGRQYVSHNVHGLIHLADDVANFGPLDEFSAFPFENFYQSLKKFVRKGEKPLQQLARRYGEMEEISHEKSKTLGELKFHGNSNGPILDGCTSPQYSQCIIPGGITIGTSEANNCCVLDDGSVILVKNFCYNTATKCMMAIGQMFCSKEELYSVPCVSSLLGIHLVSRPSDLQSWPVKSITRKCFRMPHPNGFVVVPLLHCELS